MRKWIKLLMLCTFSFLIFFVPLYEGKTTVLLICDFIKNTTKQYQHAMIFGLAGYKLIDYIKKKNAYMVLKGNPSCRQVYITDGGNGDERY